MTGTMFCCVLTVLSTLINWILELIHVKFNSNGGKSHVVKIRGAVCVGTLHASLELER